MSQTILMCGYPASGKSTIAKQIGYEHLNRDKEGGSVLDLLPRMERFLKAGKPVVIDNLFPTIVSRKPFVQLAQQYGGIYCYLLETTIEDAQFNACLRMVEKYQKLPGPEDFSRYGKNDPNTFPPAVLFKYRKEFQPPTVSEGFKDIIHVPFHRIIPDTYCNKALFVDFDGTVRKTRSGAPFPRDPDDVVLIPGVPNALTAYKKAGYRIIGVSNQSAISKGDLTHEAVRDCFDRTCDMLGMDIEYSYCPHNPAPISCYCRKPMPGLFILYMRKYFLDPAQCIMVGDMTTDETFAKRSGIRFIHSEQFTKSKPK